jgi:hypothetical protein
MANGSRQNMDGADSGDDLLIKVFVRCDLYTALFAIGALIVVILAYVPIIRAHQGWEDQIYWISTWSPRSRQHARPAGVSGDARRVSCARFSRVGCGAGE